MTKIRFTIGDSPNWNEIQVDFELSGEVVPDEQHLAYIIMQNQKRLQSQKAKKVEVLDDLGNLKAKSSNILECGNLEYNKK